MTRAQIETQISEAILNELAPPALSRLEPDTPLFETVLDSTSVLALVAHLELTYRIEIRDAEVVPSNFSTLRRLSEFLAAKLALPA